MSKNTEENIMTNFGVDIRFGQGSFEMQRMLR
jgi:hypothetical protein